MWGGPACTEQIKGHLHLLSLFHFSSCMFQFTVLVTLAQHTADLGRRGGGGEGGRHSGNQYHAYVMNPRFAWEIMR